jgi:hypothetical protein
MFNPLGRTDIKGNSYNPSADGLSLLPQFPQNLPKHT